MAVIHHEARGLQDLDIRSRIHPDLRSSLLGLDFAALSPDQVRLIFADNAEEVLKNFVRVARERQLLP